VRRLLSVFGVATLVWAAAATSVVASGPSADNAASPPGRILGIVPVLDQSRGGARPQRSSNLSYHDGPVMLGGNRTYTIFWAGDSANPDWGDSKYISTIQGYFADVAAATGARQTTNVYWSDTQYWDASSAKISVASSVGAPPYLATNPYPNDCTDKATKICNSDAALQAEIATVMAANGWTAVGSDGVQNLFFVFTPKGVGSCAGTSCAYTNYCAYHSWFSGATGTVLYANQPYAAQNYRIYTCDSGQRPNGTTADATLNVVSHEHNEAITDEQGTAWYDNQGYENGDKCAWNFGTASGPSGAMYNQTIGKHNYYLQQEWSNASTGCVLTGQ
jgi:hypothetical protein